MTDRELLEKAAKAAGINAVWYDATGCFMRTQPGQGLTRWEPLTDDGDALRLAVKVRAFGHPEFIRLLGAARFELPDQDDVAAYRLAIVRAAAATQEKT